MTYKLQNYIKILVLQYFLTFLDPSNQGTKFSWQRFPDMITGIILAQCSLNAGLKKHQERETEYFIRREIKSLLIEHKALLEEKP